MNEEKNNQLMYQNNRLFLVVVSVFLFCCFKSNVLRTIIFFISSLFLFMKTKGGDVCCVWYQFLFFCKTVCMSETS